MPSFEEGMQELANVMHGIQLPPGARVEITIEQLSEEDPRGDQGVCNLKSHQRTSGEWKYLMQASGPRNVPGREPENGGDHSYPSNGENPGQLSSPSRIDSATSVAQWRLLTIDTESWKDSLTEEAAHADGKICYGSANAAPTYPGRASDAALGLGRADSDWVSEASGRELVVWNTPDPAFSNVSRPVRPFGELHSQIRAITAHNERKFTNKRHLPNTSSSDDDNGFKKLRTAEVEKEDDKDAHQDVPANLHDQRPAADDFRGGLCTLLRAPAYLPKRAILLGGLPSDITYQELLSRVFGGQVVSVQLAHPGNSKDYSYAMVAFLEAQAAARYEAFAKMHGIFFRRQYVASVGLIPTSTWPLEPELIAQIYENGATRCVILSYCPAELTRGQVEQDILDHLNVRRDCSKGIIAHIERQKHDSTVRVSFTDIKRAVIIHEELLKTAKYQTSRMKHVTMGYLPDPCAQMVTDLLHRRGVLLQR